MKKLLIGAAIALPLSLAIVPASALPGAALGERIASETIEVKGGHGRGHGWGRAHGFAPRGWSRGRKVGWHGRGCPPGHWKKGWC
jgi:hypothetical protein